MREFFYRPENAWAGDFIPFFKDNKFWLFYLHDWRNNEKYGEGMPWYLISTNDFINFNEHGEVLPRGGKNEQDLYVFTGSVIEVGEIYHIFYTGYNPYFKELGKPTQAIMHAISKDLFNWEKISEDTFYADKSIYEQDDWRDPFVFWNNEAREYWLLLATRLKNCPSRRRGCIALCTSKDLKNWKICKPFWAPSLYYTHECPDLFKIGDWWYLIYSTFSERYVTHYRKSKSLKGPWLVPENDAFDGRAFYAAKTYSNKKHRYIFGWNPTKERENDNQEWQWGGNLVIHQIIQEDDGSLFVRVPIDIDEAFPKELPILFSSGIGNWQIINGEVEMTAGDSFTCAVAQDMPIRCKITINLTFNEHTSGCGIMLRTNDDLENAYYIRLEPFRNRLVFDSWPRKGDRPYKIELERPIKLAENKSYNIKIFIDDNICVVYLDNKIAMSNRIYNLKKGRWGIFTNDGKTTFRNIKMSVINK
jgi:beta-fructofuranosidase